MLKNLIFDVGGVLLEYQWYKALTDLGYDETEAQEVGKKLVRDPIWPMMDYGVMTIDEVREKLKLVYPELEEMMAEILKNPKVLAVPRPEIWDQIRRLKEAGYRIFLLSNYGEELWEAHVAHQPFMQHVEDAVISCRIHMVKPQRRIYTYALQKFGIRGEESVFFDDRPENTLAARKAGLPAITVSSREDLNQILERLLEEGEESLPEERRV
jgi:hypothetical protein